MRLALGNGIRSDTWVDFLERFGNIHICEFYGATESSVAFVNYTGKIGAVGREHFLHKVRENPKSHNILVFFFTGIKGVSLSKNFIITGYIIMYI